MQWESPASDGGVDIDSYTVSITVVPLTVQSSNLLTTNLTLSYNEMHMVSITASNCAGEGTASVVTIHEGMNGFLHCHQAYCEYMCVLLQLAVAPHLPHLVDPWETSPAHRRGQR